MNFVNSRVLWAIPIVLPGVIWFLWWSWRKRNALVRLFVSERLLPQLLESYSPERRKIKMALQVAAVLFLMLALARPQWGFVWEEANQQGRDILVAIDTSRSMLAPDMAPNRLTRAKLAALDLMRLAKNDRLGLIAFAGAAFLQCPLTLDDEAFRQSIEALDTSIIPQGGTAVTEAIHTAVKTFATEEGDNHKVLIIFTDGEDHDGGALMAAEDADNHKLKIFTVGVGTPAGELVQVLDEGGNSTYVKDEKGNVVKSRLNEDLLRQIATAAKGFYIPLREGNAMQVLYQRGLEPLPTSDISSKLVRQLNEQFHWPLGIAIALLLTEALLPAAAKKRPTSVKRSETPKAAVAAMLLLMLAASTQASPARAYRDYKNGNFKDARNEYERLLEKRPDDPNLNYNAGAASYRAGAYDKAAKEFSNATKAPELDLQARAYYNLGNANYRLGSGQPTPDKKMALWRQAVQNFESAMKLNPQDADAKFNHELVQKQLEELKKQQQQQKQDKNDDKDEKKNDKKEQQQQQDNKDRKDEDQQQKKSDESKSNEEKKDEQQRQDQQQDQQQSEKQQQEKQDKPEAKNPNGQEQADKNAEQQREAEQEARAAQLAQMTPKQAEQMLDAQKTEEKALIYRQYDERKKKRNATIKDW
ncbi:MAG TPA: VWA domain-containing protein [Verrucomicrobiae bacterium]|nr:VWA domain-containing protein [Verrucomicrobiae bacterium]